MERAPDKEIVQLPTLDAVPTGTRLEEAWRIACQDVADAYRHWCLAPSEQRRDAYAVYLAAADREGAAADHLRAALEAV